MEQFQKAAADHQAPDAFHGPTCSPTEGTLLLGDTNLTAIRTSDLKTECSVRTIKEANIDLIRCWISEKLQWAPGYCILYCGLQDILDKNQLEDIFDRLGSLVASLKQINEDMVIHICELAPVLRVQEFDEIINNFNNQLAAWSAKNGISVIKTNLQFRLGTGEIDQMCLHVNSGSQGNFLNRLGVIRLLNIISKQCPFFKLSDNWDTITRQEVIAPFSEGSQGVANKRGYSQTHMEGSRAPRFRNTDLSYQNTIKNYQDYPRRHFTAQRGGSGRRNSQFSIGGDHHGRHGSSSDEAWRRNSATNFAGYKYGRTQTGEAVNLSRRRPCYNCGELGHALFQCQFYRRIRCDRCKGYGHKTRLCQNRE